MVLDHGAPLGPVRENQISVERRGLAPVPQSERYGRTFRIFTVWLSPQFAPSALFIGVIAASLALGFWQGLPAIVIGNIVGALAVAYLSTWGPRTGMGQLPLSGRRSASPMCCRGWSTGRQPSGGSRSTTCSGQPR